MAQKLSKRDLERIDGIHGDLRLVVEDAWQLFDGQEVLGLPKAKLIIVEGLRSLEKQKQMVKAGRSWTMNSRHLTGHAIDFAIIDDGIAVWEMPLYEKVWLACFRPAKIIGIPLTWGGSWKTKDGPHVELDWKHYPKET